MSSCRQLPAILLHKYFGVLRSAFFDVHTLDPLSNSQVPFYLRLIFSLLLSASSFPLFLGLYHYFTFPPLVFYPLCLRGHNNYLFLLREAQVHGLSASQELILTHSRCSLNDFRESYWRELA